MRPADLVAGSVLPMMAVPAAAVIGLLYWMWRRSQQLERRNKTAPQRPPRPRPPRTSLNELRGYFNNGLDDYNRATDAGEPTASEVRWMHESGLTSGVLPSPLFKACRGITHNSLQPLPPRSFFMSSHATLSSRRYVRANSRGGTARTVTSSSSTPAKSKRPPLRCRSMDTHIHAEACVACASRGHALIYNNPHTAGSRVHYFLVRLISERFLVQFPLIAFVPLRLMY